MDHMISEDGLARGLEYVRRNGSELMGALADHATGVASGDDVLVHLLPYQNDDGGWKRFDDDMEGALSTISQTWLGLQWLSWTCPFDSAPSIAAPRRAIAVLMSGNRAGSERALMSAATNSRAASSDRGPRLARTRAASGRILSSTESWRSNSVSGLWNLQRRGRMQVSLWGAAGYPGRESVGALGHWDGA